MATADLLNEQVIRIVLRTKTDAELENNSVLGNVHFGEPIYINDTNRLAVCDLGTNGATNGTIVELGFPESDIMAFGMIR